MHRTKRSIAIASNHNTAARCSGAAAPQAKAASGPVSAHARGVRVHQNLINRHNSDGERDNNFFRKFKKEIVFANFFHLRIVTTRGFLISEHARTFISRTAGRTVLRFSSPTQRVASL